MSLGRMSKRNPSVAGLLCAICGSPAESYCHITHRGMGGDPADNRTDGFPSCGVDHSGNRCHGLVGQHHLKPFRGSDGLLRYSATEKGAKALRRRSVSCHEGSIHVALYEGVTFDDAQAPREEIAR